MPSVKLPYFSELQFSYARSSGPGGQNVNKVATKARLAWEIDATSLYTPEEIDRIKRAAYQAGFLTEAGLIVITDQHSRSQETNRKAAYEKLKALVIRALKPRKKRVKTKVPRNQREKRIQSKKIRSDRKRMRGRINSSTE